MRKKSEYDYEEPDHNTSNEDEKLLTLTPILYDLMHAIGNRQHWQTWGKCISYAAPIDECEKKSTQRKRQNKLENIFGLLPKNIKKQK